MDHADTVSEIAVNPKHVEEVLDRLLKRIRDDLNREAKKNPPAK